MTHTHRHRHTQPPAGRPADRPTNNGTLLPIQCNATHPHILLADCANPPAIEDRSTTAHTNGEKEQQTPYRSGANADTQHDRCHNAT